MQDHFRRQMAKLENEHWWYRARRNILEHAVDQFIGVTDRALTVGVGATREAQMLSKRTRLFAVDHAPILSECKKYSIATQADALALPFQSESFDAAFVFDVLEHIDDERALKELYRVVKSQGHILVTVPAFMFLFGRQDIVSEHKRRYRRGALSKLLENAGFHVNYTTYFNTLLFPPIATLRLLRKLFVRQTKKHVQSDFDFRLPASFEKVLETIFELERHVIGRAIMPVGVSILCSARRD